MPKRKKAGISMVVEIDDFILYPNPSDRGLIIKIRNDYLPVGISVIDNIGKEVFLKDKYKEEQIFIDTNTFSNGIYFVTLINEDGEKKSKKFVVQHR